MRNLPPKGIAIIGHTGQGKTHAATLIAADAARRGRKVLYSVTDSDTGKLALSNIESLAQLWKCSTTLIRTTLHFAQSGSVTVSDTSLESGRYYDLHVCDEVTPTYTKDAGYMIQTVGTKQAAKDQT